MVLLLFLVQLLILLPPVQKKIKSLAESAMREQLDAEVSIRKINIAFPKTVKVHDILIFKEPEDTLLHQGELTVNVGLLALLNHTILIKRLELKDGYADFGRLLEQLPADTASGNAEQDEETSSPAWGFEIRHLVIESCYYKYRDDRDAGFELILDLGLAKLLVGQLDLENLIAFERVETNNTLVSYESLEVPGPEVEDTSATRFADIRVGRVRLATSEFRYIDSTGALVFTAGGEQVDVDDLLVDINHETVAIDEGFAKNTTCSVLFLPAPPDTAAPEADEGMNWGASLWRVEGNTMDLEGFRMTVDDQASPDPPGHFNGSHMDINHVTGTLSDFIVYDGNLTVKISGLSGREKNGLEILQMDGEMKQDGELFTISGLKLTTAVASYSIDLATGISPTDYSDLEHKRLDLDLSIQSKGWHDIDYFYPFLDSVDILADGFINNAFDLQLALQGNTDELEVARLDIHYLDHTQMSASARVKGLLGGDTPDIRLDLEDLTVTRADVVQTIDGLGVDSAYTLPEYVRLKGVYSGNSDLQSFTGSILTDLGSIDVDKLSMQQGQQPLYSARLKADLDHLDRLLRSGLKRATFRLDASMEGTDLYEAFADLTLDIDTLGFNDYLYHNVELKALLQEGELIADLGSEDTNLMFDMQVEGILSQLHQEVMLELALDSVDLHALNLYDQELKIYSEASFRISFFSEEQYGAQAEISSLDLYHSDTLYRMHPITFQFATSPENTDVHLKSYFYYFDLTSKSTLETLLEDLAGLPAHYLADSAADVHHDFLPAFRVAGELDYPEAFARSFFPGLPEFDKLIIHGGYDSPMDRLSLDITLYDAQYGSLFADSLDLSLQGSSADLDYDGSVAMEVDGLLSGQLDLSGSFREQRLVNRLEYSDSRGGKYLDISTLIRQPEQDILISILPDSLTFSYDPWEIGPDNELTIALDHISVRDLTLQHDEQIISITSSPEEEPTDLELVLENFRLGSLEQLLEVDTLVSGIANADLHFRNILSDLSVEGNLSIDSLGFYDVQAGRLEMPVFRYGGGRLETELTLVGTHNDLALKGSLSLDQEPVPVVAELLINRLDLDELNYVFREDLSDMKGELQGRIGVSGNIDQPELNGYLGFRDAGVGINSINNYFTLGDEKISLEDNVISFNQFSIVNRQGQSARIDGFVSLEENGKAYSDLKIETDDMVVINSTQQDNEMVFGFLKAQADFGIKGHSDDLSVTANVKVDEETDITYSFPDELSLDDNSGTVQFVEFSADTMENRKVQEGATFFSMGAVHNISSYIEIEEGARFKLFFDESGHDYLDAMLNGTVNFSNKDGVQETSGMMEIESGKLKYGIPMVTVDEYTIEPGSFLTVSNDLYDPYLNIVASANVRASTESLMGSYAKVMTFKVMLYMTGELKDVKLRFDISNETSDALVSAKLAQLSEEERNMNALNLLVRGSFVMSMKGDEIGGTSMADAQLDKFYTAHLNHLISENIHFVDLHFDVQSFKDYNETGEKVLQRNYYYNVGKSFFNERARINYKGSLGVTNHSNAEQLNSQFVQNELEVEVKITKAGTVRAVFFRKNQYEGLLEGEIIETGGGIRLHKDFYNVRDVFVNELKKPKH